jgi:LacI family transcriptional regulator
MPTGPRITIRDIARETGLSTAAVSHALRPRSDSNIKLHQETIERVRRAAAELNYQPHSGARSIRSNRFNTIGYFIAKTGRFTNTPYGYMAGVHDVAEEHGYRMTLIRLPRSAEDITRTMPSVFRERNLDALIIESYNELADQIYQRIQTARMPVVFVNDRHRTNSVYVDDEWGAEQLTNHLLERGYRKIAYVQRTTTDGPPAARMHHSAADRAKGFRKAMAKADRGAVFLTVRTAGVVGPDVELAPEDWREIARHDAVVAYDDDLANLIARTAYARQRRIPDALAVAGFNGDYASLCAWRRLTTMRIPSYEMGCQAAKMAFELVDGAAGTAIPSAVFRPTLIEGETT